MSKDFSNLLSGAISNKQQNETNIIDKIVIKEEFKELIPLLASEELQQLEENILKEGVRDPLVLWESNGIYILVDGHNRYSVCKKHNLTFPFKIAHFIDEEDVKDWMIRNQLGRRNLTQEQQSYLRGLRYLKEKSQGKRSDLTTSGQNVQKLNTETTAESLAKEYNVSAKTIIRDGEFAKGIDVIAKKDPEQKKKILKGESHISKAKVQKLAKQPEKIDSLLTVEPAIQEPQKKRISAEEVAKIALDYIAREIASPQSFYYSLGRDYENIDPVEFFEVWNEFQKTKSNNPK